MFDELTKYVKNGHFFFNGSAPLKDVCNAPKDGIGIYLVYSLKDGDIELMYIGSTGKVLQNGDLSIRIGGIYDEIVNGKQFGYPRSKSWHQKLVSERIEAFDIYWYKTFDNLSNDIPATIEGIIMQRFYEIYGQLPGWNKEF